MRLFKNNIDEIRTYTYTPDDFISMYLWLALADVLKVLKLNNSATRKLKAEEPEIFMTAQDGTKLIRERGFYYLLLFASKTPEAKKFTKQFVPKDKRLTKKLKAQVMDNVMKELSKTNYHLGGYSWLPYSY